MTRSQSREQAFALLFEKSFNPETDMDDIISLSLENELIEPDEFASMLAQTAWDKLFSINEAVELCKKYATAEDASFVNGVLGSVAREEKLADRSGSDAPEGE